MDPPGPQQPRCDILSWLRTTSWTPRVCGGHFAFFVPNSYNMSVYGLPKNLAVRIWYIFTQIFGHLYYTIPWGAGASRGGPKGRFCEYKKNINGKKCGSKVRNSLFPQPTIRLLEKDCMTPAQHKYFRAWILARPNIKKSEFSRVLKLFHTWAWYLVTLLRQEKSLCRLRRRFLLVFCVTQNHE